MAAVTAGAGGDKESPSGGAATVEAGFAPGTLIKCVLRYSPLSRQMLAAHDSAPAVATSASVVEKRVGLVSVGCGYVVSGGPTVSPRGRQ